MVTTINYSTSARSSNVNLTKCKTWGLTAKHTATDPHGTLLAPQTWSSDPECSPRHPQRYTNVPVFSPTCFLHFDVAAHCKFDKACLLYCAGETVRKAEQRGKSNPFLLKTEPVAQQRCCSGPFMIQAQIHVSLAETTLLQVPHTFVVITLIFFYQMLHFYFYFYFLKAQKWPFQSTWESCFTEEFRAKDTKPASTYSCELW